MQTNLPEVIEDFKKKLGTSVTIVAHHYQSDEVVRHAQFVGDSLELSQKIPKIESENIIFCGVEFMAESAKILTRPEQKVYMPAPEADCVMARTVPHKLLEQVMLQLQAKGLKALPLAYVNTSVGVKAVVGKYGGAVCTSSNSQKMLRWAFDKSELVIFLPDKNLGANTAHQIGLNDEQMALLDIRAQATKLEIFPKRCKLLLWPGCCAIHARFRKGQMDELRKNYPGIKVVVHPECSPEVVQNSDAVGSTSFILKYTQEAPAGSILAVGTEIHLVQRLAKKHAARGVKILPLFASSCSDMTKTTAENLKDCLERILSKDATLPQTQVDQEDISFARLALTRMLEQN